MQIAQIARVCAFSAFYERKITIFQAEMANFAAQNKGFQFFVENESSFVEMQYPFVK